MQWAINGGKLGRTSPAITKLVYANDAILIFKAQQAGVSAMAECLLKYCASSSQNIDIEKSRLSSSHGVPSLIPNTDLEPKGFETITQR